MRYKSGMLLIYAEEKFLYREFYLIVSVTNDIITYYYNRANYIHQSKVTTMQLSDFVKFCEFSKLRISLYET